MLRYFKNYYDDSDNESIAHKFRMKRFLLFNKTFANILSSGEKVKILDVGGTEMYWENMGITKYPKICILLLNLAKESTSNKNIESISGNACDMKEFNNNQFDIVFSNSVIEHVGDFQRQKSMANEIMRVGKNYFLQTPNYYFPFEPHYLFVGIHWLPVTFRAFLITRYSLGWVKRIPDYNQALKFVKDIRLLKYKELKSLFPRATILREKYIGLTKSFIVIELNNGQTTA